MTNLWATFSTDTSGSFTELSGNIIYNLNNLYNFNGNLVDTTSYFIIYELSNNPIQGGISLEASNWKQLNLNTILNPFQGYWLGGINTKLPQIFGNRLELRPAVHNWITNPIPVENEYGYISNWHVGNVTNMNGMFAYSHFNGNISNWNVGNVTKMNGMFLATLFNQDISNWDVAKVIDMGTMFSHSSFNQDISNWHVGNVTNMNSMFYNAIFNGNISNWDVGKVTNMNTMFYKAIFNQDISNWNVGNVRNMSLMFADSSFNGNISNWNVGNVTNMGNMFADSPFNGNISNWHVGNVTNMSYMFYNAINFNQDISNWDVGNIADGNFNEMFKNVSFFTDMNTKIYSNGTPFNYFIYQQNTINQNELKRIIFSNQNLNNSNLGSRWILKNLQNQYGHSGGSITTSSDIEANINEIYTGILEIDTSNDPDVNTSYTNYVYHNTSINIFQNPSSTSYDIWLTWQDENIVIDNLSLTFN